MLVKDPVSMKACARSSNLVSCFQSPVGRFEESKKGKQKKSNKRRNRSRVR